MAGSILGTRVQRTEDPELLLGSAHYVGDLAPSGQLDGAVHAVFVRSEMAHARIRSIDVAEAAAAPGVVGVFTAADLSLPAIHGFVKVHDDFARPPLADGTVRFVGEAVAVVVADTAVHARDAADLVYVDYEPLPVVVDPEQSFLDDAAVIFPGHGDNLAVAVTDAVHPDIFGDADVVVRGRYVNQRIAIAAMEPHTCAAAVDERGRLVVYGSTQMPHVLHMIMRRSLGMKADELRIITPHVGGGFGGKAGMYPEQLVVGVLAKQLQRPVTWTSTRTEDSLALAHSRAQIQYVELGCRSDGTFTGLRVHLVGDAGAYPGMGAMLPAGTRRMSNGTYAFTGLQFDIAVGITNTTPTSAYRGAGRPEATALLERVVDQAALTLGIDPIEIRHRNLLADDVFPFTTFTGVTYDTGAYRTPLDEAARLVGYDALRTEQAARRARGDRMLLGIGVAAYVEITAGGTASEFGAVEVHPDGTATVRCGTSAHGQGHQTSYAMIVSAQTGIAIDRIRLVQGDTDLVPRGGGTGGSRSLQVGGSAVHKATEAMVQKARAFAATLLEADPADVVIDLAAGTVGVAGVPASAFTWGELAAAAEREPDAIDHEDGSTGLAAQLVFDQGDATFPFGAHIAVVEVDQDTGEVTLVEHVAVDDCGTVLNPLLVEGQQHGGVAAGVGQALYEEVRYDGDGNPLTATFMDYGVPSAAELPSFRVHSTETPTHLNPLGAKGIGEASTIGSTPAVQNAVIDALAHLGVRHLDLPCTPMRVWQAIRDAEAGTLPDPWQEPPAVFARLAAGQDVDAEALKAAEGI